MRNKLLDELKGKRTSLNGVKMRPPLNITLLIFKTL